MPSVQKKTGAVAGDVKRESTIDDQEDSGDVRSKDRKGQVPRKRKATTSAEVDVKAEEDTAGARATRARKAGRAGARGRG